MRTPFGFECPYFYGNYFRGKKQEECRLILETSSLQGWNSGLCKTCSVPEIINANACPNLKLSAHIAKRLFGLKSYVQISAYCTKEDVNVKEPQIGCGQCHPLPTILMDKNN